LLSRFNYSTKRAHPKYAEWIRASVVEKMGKNGYHIKENIDYKFPAEYNEGDDEIGYTLLINFLKNTILKLCCQTSSVIVLEGID